MKSVFKFFFKFRSIHSSFWAHFKKWISKNCGRVLIMWPHLYEMDVLVRLLTISRYFYSKLGPHHVVHMTNGHFSALQNNSIWSFLCVCETLWMPREICTGFLTIWIDFKSRSNVRCSKIVHITWLWNSQFEFLVENIFMKIE